MSLTDSSALTSAGAKASHEAFSSTRTFSTCRKETRGRQTAATVSRNRRRWPGTWLTSFSITDLRESMARSNSPSFAGNFADLEQRGQLALVRAQHQRRPRTAARWHGRRRTTPGSTRIPGSAVPDFQHRRGLPSDGVDGLQLRPPALLQRVEARVGKRDGSLRRKQRSSSRVSWSKKSSWAL